MTPAQKIGALTTIVVTLAGIFKLWLQMKAARELREETARKDQAIARMQAENTERIARHARESDERKAEREQKEALISSLQKAQDETLSILKNEITANQQISAKSFEYLDRNTKATETLAQAVASQAADLRVLTTQIAELKGGAGCRARSV